MLYRKIIKKIENWYKKSSSSLLIDGARQIGKTTIIREFLNSNKIDYIEINLISDKTMLEAFNTSSNHEQLFLRLTSFTKKELKEKETVIFIDEIQEAKDAITSIKFLTESYNYKFIFSTSLLGIKMQNIHSIPLGYLEILEMYPLDFEEFLLAFNISKKTFNYLNNCFDNKVEVDDIIHKQMMEIFKLYLIVGRECLKLFKLL